MARRAARPGVIVVLMGVAGTGKTTVGRRLAHALGWRFRDADAFHPAANVAKMRRGEPLTDADREPWLDALARLVADEHHAGRNLVLACSALRRAYRERLARGVPGVLWVHLTGDPALLRERLRRRRGHFAGTDLLPSQLETLEPPADALAVDVAAPPDAIVARIRRHFGL
jgi:gluconokinase